MTERIPVLHDIISTPYVRHSDTSKSAAEAIEPKVGTLRRKVLDRIRLTGSYGVTDEQGWHALNMDQNTYRPRRIELWRAGLVKDSGKRRRTTKGRTAVVWVAA